MTTNNNENGNKDKNTKVVSEHKQNGKHTLKYDTIFKGSKEKVEQESDISTTYHNESFGYDVSSNYYHETTNNHDYLRERKLKQKIYDTLTTHTTINLSNNRRKPSKVAFNEYYSLLKSELKIDSFTNVEIFNELSFYFSDNLSNMLKLLDNKWRDLIIQELQDHVGKKPENSKDVNIKNLTIDAEIEFYVKDSNGVEKTITGIIDERDMEEGFYLVNSYEHIYEVHVSKVKKILNNTKFKYNLNKLNNIDFI